MTTKAKVAIGVIAAACILTIPTLNYLDARRWEAAQQEVAQLNAEYKAQAQKEKEEQEKAAGEEATKPAPQPEKPAEAPKVEAAQAEPVQQPAIDKPQPIVTEDEEGNVTTIPQYPKTPHPEETPGSGQQTAPTNNTPEWGEERIDPETGEKQFYDPVFGWVTPGEGSTEIAENAGTGEVIGH